MLHLKKTISFAIFTFLLAFLSCKKEETKPIPTVSFTFSGSNVAAPATVTFINNSTNASSYLWDFGDSTASILPNPSHTYLKGGNYTVKLTATGSGGSNTQTQSITILNPTALKITVIDDLSNIVKGATVKLFPTYNDWLYSTNQIGPALITNTQGFVTFSGLQSKRYYWDASIGCRNNYNTSYYNINNLQANSTTSFNCRVSSTGTLTFTNNSSNPYSISVNGTVAFPSVEAGSTTYLYSKPTGTYTIVVTQLSGYLLFPTVRTYNLNLGCGDNIVTAFP